MKKKAWILSLISPVAMANSLMDITDDQFIRLFSMDIPDECVHYYWGDTQSLNQEIDNLAIIDKPGYSARPATTDEKQATMNDLLGVLEQRCYQDVRRAIVSNNYYEDMPEDLYADDFSDRRVLKRYEKLIGLDRPLS